MLYSNHKNIRDRITELLVVQRLSVKEVRQQLADQGELCSLQAIYDALRLLIEAGVVLKYKQSYFVSEEWKNHVVQQLHIIPAEPLLQPGEMKRYVFHSTVQLDKYWKHTNAVLMQTYPNQPFFFYNPHEFWQYNLEQRVSQDQFLRSFKQAKRSAYMLIGGKTKFDELYRDEFKRSLSIHLDEMVSYPRNQHITVCNDYVITTKIPIEVATKIDSLYLTCEAADTLEAEMTSLLKQELRLSVTIKNDSALAVKIRKRIARDLYIPLSEREQFGLFSEAEEH